MALREIKTTLTLDGEKEFKKELESAARNLRVMGSELKQASAEYDKSGDKASYLASKSRILNDEIAQQKEIFNALNAKIKAAAGTTEEASAKTDGYRIRMNNAAAAIARMERELADTDREMEELGRDSAKVGRQIEDGIGDSAEKAAKSLDEMYEKLQSDIGNIRNSAAISAVLDLGGAVIDTGQALNDFAESSRDYRRQMSFLEQNAKDAGTSMADVKGLYMEVVGLTGDVEGTFEGISNLLAIGFDTSDMELAIESLAGAVIKFPETMKFENLAESLQESISTGEATGAFAEMMDRMSLSTEDFAEAMKAANNEEERLQVALSFLNAMNLRPTTAEYKEANADLIAAEKSTQNLSDAMSELGGIVDTKITPVKNKIANAVRGVSEVLSEGGEEGYWDKAWDEALGIIKTEGSEMIQELSETAKEASEKVGGIMGTLAGTIAEKGTEVIGAAEEVMKGVSEKLGFQYTEEELSAAAESSKGLREELERLNAEQMHAYEIGDGKRAWELQAEIDKILKEIARAESEAMSGLESETADGIKKSGDAAIQATGDIASEMEKEWSEPIEGVKTKSAEMMQALGTEIMTRGAEIIEAAGGIAESIAEKITDGLDAAQKAMGARYTEEELTAASMASADIRSEYEAIEEEIIEAYAQNDTKRALELVARKSELQRAIAEAEKSAIAEVERAVESDGGQAADTTLEDMKNAIVEGAPAAKTVMRKTGREITEAYVEGAEEGGITAGDAAGEVMDEMTGKWTDKIGTIRTYVKEVMQAVDKEIELGGQETAEKAGKNSESIADKIVGGLSAAKAALRTQYTEEELAAARESSKELRAEYDAIEEEIINAYMQGDGKRALELNARKMELQSMIAEEEIAAINEVGKTGAESGANAGSLAMSEMQSAIAEGAPAAQEAAGIAGENVMTALANGITTGGSAAIEAAAAVVSAINATLSQVAMPDLSGISYQYYSAPSSPSGAGGGNLFRTSVSLNVDGKRMASVVTPYVSSLLSSSSRRYGALA